MIVVFWQNVISPHQLPFISKVCDDKRISFVYLIVAEEINEKRKVMGWEKIHYQNNKLKIIINPIPKEISEIYNNTSGNSYHFYSGLRAFPFVFTAFKISLAYNLKRGLIVEHPFLYKRPIILHYVKTLLFDRKYYKNFDKVFAFGSKAVKWYSQWNKKWNVIEFAYCVDGPKYSINTNRKGPSFIYIGALTTRKNVQYAIKSFSRIENTKDYKFEIVGDGLEYNKLLAHVLSVGLENKISFTGKLSMNAIKNNLTNYDVLILPSYFDGWGAVINEAIMAGLFVLCSSNCGSKALVNELTGKVFDLNFGANDLTEKINWCINNISFIRETKEARYEWSKKITGKSVSQYFVDKLLNINTPPPWID